LARLSRDRRGISDAIITTILFTTFITICLSTIYYAQLNIVVQSGQVELENAARSMVSLADTIEGLEKRGQAAYVRVLSETGGIGVAQDEKLKISVGVETREYNITLIEFRSGVPSESFRVFKGVSNTDPSRFLIASPGSPAPLGWVYLKRSREAWIIVDFGRVRIVPTGRVSVKGNNYTLVDVTYINIVKGSLSGAGTFNICVKVRSVRVETVYAPLPTTITVERGGFSENYPIEREEGVQEAIVFINIIDVEVSTV